MDGDEAFCGVMTEEKVTHPLGGVRFAYASRNGAIRSIGTGKIVVEFFSEAISVSVCK
jgi:hypothetical protein